MKGVLGWLRSHLMIVICTVVVPASLASGWVFSGKWNKGIRDEQSQRANNAYNKIKNAKVTYVIPSLFPDERAWSESRPPNRVVTEFVARERDARLGSAASVVSEVLEFNRRGHALLQPDLLPVPVSAQRETSLKYELLGKLAGDAQLGIDSVYEDLFVGIGAGDPPDPVRLATSLKDLRDRETERRLDESGTASLTPEQTEELDTLLSQRRIGEVQRRAKELSVYGGLGSLASGSFGERSSKLPPEPRSARPSSVPPTLGEAFGWNFDYWVVSDLLAAIDRANTDSDGVRSNVEGGVVKRIERVGVEALPVKKAVAPPTQGGDEYGGAVGGPSPGTDPSVSITGRISGEAFDVVRARLTLVVDAERLPRLFQALAETNLITVLDLDITEVDVWEDLRQGYYYGGGPVVRADLEVETVWLRDWTAPLMPAEVREALGIAADEGGEG